MAGYRQPSYTQTPNELFDEQMREMDDSELRIMLVTIRKTLGYHKKSDPISLTQYQELSGLSRPGVLAGLRKCIAKGLIREVATRGRRGVKAYELVFEEDTTSKVSLPVEENTDVTSKLSLPELVNSVYPQKKIDKRNKDKEKNLSSSETIEDESTRHQTRDEEQHDKSALKESSKVTVPNPIWEALAETWNTRNPGILVNLRGMLFHVGNVRGEWKHYKLPEPMTVEEMSRFAEWSRHKMDTINGKRELPRRPETVAFWVDEFRAFEVGRRAHMEASHMQADVHIETADAQPLTQEDQAALAKKIADIKQKIIGGTHAE